VAPAPPSLDAGSRRFNRLDAVWLTIWLLFLAGLAMLPPQFEWHKQLILVAIGVVQLLEKRLISRFPTRGVSYVVLLKILLATVLIDHTGEVGINSSYYPIYYLPVVTAALYCGPWLTLFWTLLSSAAYCSYLYPAMQDYELTPEAFGYLALRIMFFFLAAMVVNRFSQQSQHQTQLYRELAERLAETNRRLEQAQAEARRSERLAALGQLSAGLAHEIRNPLGVIKGSAEMLTQKLQASDELSRELAGYISTEVNRLSALVTEFLDFARPLHAQRHPANLIALLDRVLQIVADRFKGKQFTGTQETVKQDIRKSVRVERHYAGALPPVPLDESLCEQAFLNLVQNAYEAMEDHGGTLQVEVQPATQNDREGVELRLADTGPGVPEELREEIFNPFVTTKKTGVGLGLSIVSKIVDGHHGSIHVENAPAGGAVFTLFFPLEEAVEATANSERRTANDQRQVTND
jgi:signal transduction histidine kinase